MTGGIDFARLSHDLGRYMDAYRKSLDVIATAGAAMRSPAGRFESVLVVPEVDGVPMSDEAVEYGILPRNTNPPESRPPASSDTGLRVALNLSVRNLADAIRTLTALFDDVQAWEPKALANLEPVEFFGKPVLWVVKCKANGAVDWKDADDVLTPVLPAEEVGRAVQQLRAMFGRLQTMQLDEADTDTAADAAGLVTMAVDSLRYKGMWGNPQQKPEPPRCEEDGCETVPEWGRNAYRRRCSKHRHEKGRAA